MYTNADLKISLYVRVHVKTHPQNFAFLILRFLELFTREICKFLKKWLILTYYIVSECL